MPAAMCWQRPTTFGSRIEKTNHKDILEGTGPFENGLTEVQFRTCSTFDGGKSEGVALQKGVIGRAGTLAMKAANPL